ncbi:MAG: transposase [Saprospiraceae bacterium]|jgi:transposase
MSKPKKKYTKEEKLEIVKLSLEDNQSIKDLATRFEVGENTLYNWRSSFLKNKDASFPGKGNKTMSESERKIHELEKELRETRLERDILKKAVGIFSKSDRKFSNL